MCVGSLVPPPWSRCRRRLNGESQHLRRPSRSTSGFSRLARLHQRRRRFDYTSDELISRITSLTSPPTCLQHRKPTTSVRGRVTDGGSLEAHAQFGFDGHGIQGTAVYICRIDLGTGGRQMTPRAAAARSAPCEPPRWGASSATYTTTAVHLLGQQVAWRRHGRDN